MFYSIAAKGINELKARSKEKQEVLERGLLKLENIIKRIKNEKKY